ncbi:hypothetical protein B0H19DRAFT_1323241 [Mycena capillaripes]|nr:hypothetical protein B0H19DRAFT_1323241 [Mycena capillaripes]
MFPKAIIIKPQKAPFVLGSREIPSPSKGEVLIKKWDASQFIEDTLEQQALYSMAALIHPSFSPGSTPLSEASASISESLALHMTDHLAMEEPNEVGDEWEWNPCETVWLDAGVSSDVYIPEDPFPVTSNCKVVRKPITPRKEKSMLVVVAKVAKNEWNASTRCGQRERKEKCAQHSVTVGFFPVEVGLVEIDELRDW